MELTYFTTVKAYQTRKDGSMIVVIPKDFVNELDIQKGTKFRVWHDKNKLVYEPQKQVD